MLELKNIKKDYYVGDNVVKALRGLDLKFRENEFVSILGPSGCGKTTLLNIIGGLDKYTSGDLIINNKYTKEYKDKDWDRYRNHSIGFVFQTYNLIPHLTVLGNVEIALTISGVTKEKRKNRAIKVLKEVGLYDQIHKRPNQLSGGQMQRVAIARALVNDPEIILADEPTGALDTETGIQIMEILKKISKDHLVIMVTHNPLLADKYSSRIIKMLDGKITSDSSPVKEKLKVKDVLNKNLNNPSMSFVTAFNLSLRNLFSKKGRTVLTAFAGSIGIMGIALILAVSQGMTRYINNVQEDALTSYPLTIEETSIDIGSLMSAFMNIKKNDIEHKKDAVYKKAAIYDMVSALSNIDSRENDLKSFKKYFEEQMKEKDFENAVTGLQYSYNLDFNVYTEDPDGNVLKSNSRELLEELMTEHMGLEMSFFSGQTAYGDMSDMQTQMMGRGLISINLWQEILPGNNQEIINDVVKKQYDVVYGSWPTKYNEIVLVLDNNNELDDMTLYALGLETKESIDSLMKAALEKTKVEKTDNKWTYEEILDKQYRVILNSNMYTYDEKTDQYIDLSSTTSGLRYLYDNAVILKVSGIIRPNDDSQSSIISGSIGYTTELTKHIIKESENSKIIQAQKDNKSTDILSNLPFKNNVSDLTKQDKKEEFIKYVDTLNQKQRAGVYIELMAIPTQKNVDQFVKQTLKNYKRKDIEKIMIDGLTKSVSIDKSEIEEYIYKMNDDDLTALFKKSLEEQYKEQHKQGVKKNLSIINKAQLSQMLTQLMKTAKIDEFEIYYDEVLTFSDSTYKENLAKMGYVDLDEPKTMNIYASSFSNKEEIENVIEKYNDGKEELSQIKYTDLFGIMMSSMTNIINVITYVLLSFVAISLVVSSIMIGVITLISVQERTKEIGILRAIGASKANVSSMFNAETMIIGFTSGMIGVIVTYLLCIPINMLLHKITKINNINTFLPINAAIVLVLISVILSLISGLIPSKSAAKKEPVIALRTE